ncbi:MAG: CinA family protein [Betaproteobacteria bacterium]|nr:CinA family protein [Betaproteobacteria bacterium]
MNTSINPSTSTPATPSESALIGLASALMQRGWLLATAESCTGGMIAAACTDLAGSSQWFERGFVSYSNEAKQDMLGVPAALLAQHGAVSEAVAQAMVLGALNRSQAQVAVAVTGIAGPTGGSSNKPVGTVCFAWGMPTDGGPTVGAESAWVKLQTCHFEGDRNAVRVATRQHALHQLLVLLNQQSR